MFGKTPNPPPVTSQVFDDNEPMFTPSGGGLDGYGNFKHTTERFDNVETYGSIIHKLISPDKVLMDFEMRLIGKEPDGKGGYKRSETIKPKITDETVAREFVDIVRSFANDNINLSKLDDREVANYLMGLNYTLNRYLMLQGERVPTYYRQKISFEAMGIASASIHKAHEAHISVWSKGSLSEGAMHKPQEKRSLMDYIFPSRNKAYGGA